MKWVVTANSNQCRIYDYHHKDNQLKLLHEINHPENKLKDSEVLSDRQGRYNTMGSAHGAYSQPHDPANIHIDNFARQIAQVLDEGRNKQAYQTLILVAPSHMEGLLNEHLNKHVKSMIKQVIQKNVMHCAEHELLNYLK